MQSAVPYQKCGFGGLETHLSTTDDEQSSCETSAAVKVMLNVEISRTEIDELCRCLGVRRLDIFGSAATAELRPGSDVDVLVRFDREQGHLFNRYFELKERLEEMFGRPVDLVVEDALKNPYFIQAVERTRENVYAA